MPGWMVRWIAVGPFGDGARASMLRCLIDNDQMQARKEVLQSHLGEVEMQ